MISLSTLMVLAVGQQGSVGATSCHNILSVWVVCSPADVGYYPALAVGGHSTSV